MTKINLFDVLPSTFIQESIESREKYKNLDSLYKLNNEVRLSLLDLLRLHKLILFYGIVYSFGHGGYAWGGDRNINNYSVEIKIPINTLENDKKRVMQFSAGTNHTLLLCEDGVVYAFGNSQFGQLGNGNTHFHIEETPIPINTSLLDNKKVIQVSAGDHHSLILCEDGTVYSFGWGKDGKLGDRNTRYYSKGIPSPIDTSKMEGKKVIQVSAGRDHSLILCEDGTVYSFGLGNKGRLGDGNPHQHRQGIPTPIDTSRMVDIEGIKKKVIQVSAGGTHSLILCEDGTVYSFGCNAFGQMGEGNDIPYTEEIPSPINTSKMSGRKVTQVSAGNHYSLILCDDSTVYSFGWGKDGKLGDGNTAHHNVGTPTPINTTNLDGKQVIQVSAGDNHSLILCRDGTVYSFGCNKYRQLGVGNTNIGIPTPIDTSKINEHIAIQVSAGYSYSLIMF